MTPAGIRLDTGHRTTICFSADTNIGLWEKTVKPPGFDGGDPVDTTTMWNTTWRTKNPNDLIEMSDSEATCAYDPLMYTDLLALLDVKTTITNTFPDLSQLSYYGFLQAWEPGELAIGEQPESDVTIAVTNQDPQSGAETSPLYTNVVGT